MSSKPKKVNPKRQEKYRRWEKLWRLLDTYDTVLVVDCDNVSSQQMMDIRRLLRASGSELFKGKKPQKTDEDY